MALSGNFSSFPVSYLGLYCEWSAEQSVSGNYSNITVNVYLKYHSLYVGERTDSKVSINGESTTYTAKGINESSNSAHSKLIKSYTKKVNHNSNGEKTGVALSASWRFDGTYSGTRIGTITASTTVSLDTIDRNGPTVKQSISNITSNGFTIVASSDVTIDRWRYSLDGGSTYTTFSTTAGTSASVTLNTLNPNTTYNVTVEGRKKSNQVIGKASKTVTTLGAAVISEAPNFAADASTVSIPLTFTIFEAAYSNKVDVYNGDTLLFHLSTGFTGTAGEYKKTFTLSSSQRTTLLNAMSSVKTKEFSLVVGSYSGSTLIAESSKTIKATTSAANSAPTVGTVTAYDIMQNVGVYSFNFGNYLIRLVSKPVFQFNNFTLKNGATISHITIQIGDMPEVSLSTTSSQPMLPIQSFIPKAGTYKPKFTLYDSRGYSVSTSSFTFTRSGTTIGSYSQIYVLDYEAPKFTSIRLSRQNMVGEQVDVEVSCRYTQVPNGSINLNAIYDFKCRYKRTDQSSYGSWISLTSRTGYISNTASNITFSQTNFIALPAEYSYDFEFYISDTLGRNIDSRNPESYAASAFGLLMKGFPAIAIRNDPEGTGKAFVGINNNAPTAPCDVTGDIKMNGHKVLGFVRALGSVEDLNDTEFRDSGIWTQKYAKGTYGSNAEFNNYPCNDAGFLEVIVNNGDSPYVLQRYTAYNLSGVYIRTYYPKKSNGVEVGEWYGWRKIWNGFDESTFTSTGITVTRCYLTKTANMCTLYVVGTVNSAVTKGTDKQVGSIPEALTPEYTHSTCGIVKSYDSAAAWVNGLKTSTGAAHTNKRKVYIRPSVDMASGDAFEFTLVWNLEVEWQ